MNKSLDALTALKQKFPENVPDVHSLTDEQKAWLQIKIQALSDGSTSSGIAVSLQKIRNRLIHATEDVPDCELQKIVLFVFNNMNEIQKSVENNWK